MSQLGQCSTRPHAKQWICVEKPRRLRKRIACPPSASVSPSARARTRVRISLRPRGRAARSFARSTSSTAGSGAAADPMRAATSRFSSPRSAAARVSSEGVAEPRTSGQRAARARRAASVARVVAEALLVLVRAVVLLVEDDDAEIVRAERRARSARRPRSRVAPSRRRSHSAVRSRGPETAVQDGEAVAEARAEAPDELVRERDLGNEHERLAALREGAVDRAQVHLGLSAARDAVEQEGLRLARVDARADRFARRRLLRGERGRERVAVGKLALGRAPCFPLALRGLAHRELYEAFAGERCQRRAVDAGAAQRRLGPRSLREPFERELSAVARRARAERLAPERRRRPRLRELRQRARRQGGGEREADRTQDFRRLLP